MFGWARSSALAMRQPEKSDSPHETDITRRVFELQLLSICLWASNTVTVSVVGQPEYAQSRFSIRLWHDVPMSPRVKNVLFADFWFVIGHLSCAVMHHWHDIAGK